MMKRICQALARNPHGARNMTRVEVMAQVNASMNLRSWSPTSNGCYWRRIHAGYSAKSHDEARYSVIVNGLVRVAGKRGRRLTYELTPAGEMFARS
jgi:hypothetical protein